MDADIASRLLVSKYLLVKSGRSNSLNTDWFCQYPASSPVYKQSQSRGAGHGPVSIDNSPQLSDTAINSQVVTFLAWHDRDKDFVTKRTYLFSCELGQVMVWFSQLHVFVIGITKRTSDSNADKIES